MAIFMRSDARLLLNKKKYQKTSKNNGDNWKSRGTLDARKILNLKRGQKPKPPVLGSFMRIKSENALIASQIKKEIIATHSKVPDKRVQLSYDGNLIITSKPKNASRTVARKGMLPELNVGSFSKNVPREESMQCQPSTSMDDLEHTAIEDLLDLETLPPAYVASNSLQIANLSRKSAVSQILDKRCTMVADQFSQITNPVTNAKVLVSNLHPSVSRRDVMELFGDIGVIRSVEMNTPGSAIIEFFNEEEASKACSIYHNRLLDGLPMRCYLHSSSLPQRFAMAQRLGSPNETILGTPEARISPAIANSRSRYNPRNVQFTVKLT